MKLEGADSLLLGATSHSAPNSRNVARIRCGSDLGAENPLGHPSPPEEFDSRTGRGVVARVEGRRVGIGNLKLMEELGAEIDALAETADAMRAEAQTVMFLAVDGQLAGLIGVADPIKQSTPDAIAGLHSEGLRVVMLTGDNQKTAEAVAKRLGLDEVIADVLPDNKAETVRRLQAEGHIVAMAGDGVNDAPALAQAHVGIAMGTGTDVAMESAGVTLVQGDLRGILRAMRLSRATMRNIRQNLFFAFVYNAVGGSRRCRDPLSGVWSPAEPNACGSCDEPEFDFGDRELTSASNIQDLRA
jgi:Cu+-exporting ATPase